MGAPYRPAVRRVWADVDVTTSAVQARFSVIPAFNESLSIAECLRSLATQDFHEAVEIIVVDNNRAAGRYIGAPWLLRVSGLFPLLVERSLVAVSRTFCHPMEVFQPRAARIAQRVLATVKPGGIGIFHDGYEGEGADRGSTVAAVKIVVERLAAAGSRFPTVDELLQVPAYSCHARAAGGAHPAGSYSLSE